MKKIAFFIKHDNKSERIKDDFCNIRGIDFFDASTDVTKIPDTVVCFGGDGTILHAAEYCIEKDVPLVSVNTGNLGFLSMFGPNDKLSFQKTILQNSIDYENIKMFSAKIENSVFQTTNSFLFLNDAVIQRKISENLTNGALSIKIFIEGKIFQELVADGLIISSPIGSTAYSLSAGGAILAPELSALIITPICAHSYFCPIVLPDNCKIKIEIGDKSHDCIFYTDGKNGVSLHNGESVNIALSEKKLKIARGKYDFYSRLNNKILKWGSKNV